MIHLPNPCTRNWDKMTPVEGGRHCDACQKVIPDFTNKTESEIIAHFEATGQSCGHFRGDQITDGSTYGGWQHFFNWKRSVALLLMGSVFLVSCYRRTSGAYSAPKKKLMLKGAFKKRRHVQQKFFIDNSSEK